MSNRPSPRITIRYNADLSQSMIANGRVMYRIKANSIQDECVEAWLKGWFGDGERRFGRPIFVSSKRRAALAAKAMDELRAEG